MFLKYSFSKLKGKLRHDHSRPRSPSLRESSQQNLQDVQAVESTPNVISSTSDSLAAFSTTKGIYGNLHSLPILTTTKPAIAQETDDQTLAQGSTVDLESSTDVGNESSAQAPPEAIWDLAYDELKIEDAALVQAYERILTSRLQNTKVTSDANVMIQNDKEERKGQMHQLVKVGLDKISQETKAKSVAGSVLKTINLAQNVVTEIVKDVPQAAIPWAAVCISLELLTNPISETEANCKGVSHVVEQMNWYCELTKPLFGDKANSNTAGIQRELHRKLVDLYKKLLSFEIKSICSYYRHRGLIFLSDLIKLDDWEGNFKAVQDSEAFFKEHVRVFQSVDLGQDVKQLVSHAKDEQEYRKTDDDKKCLRDLYITDPRMDKSRIESTKGGLIHDSYRWILNNPEFKSWLHDDDKRLLWIKGDPGKGKTMLLCGIVDEIKQRVTQSNAVSFFFCQATIPTINNHLAVLRGLIWLLADQQPSLISHIREKYDPIGKDIFEGPNAWYSLRNVFRSILEDEKLTTAYIIIDGLDECTTGLDELLVLIKESLPYKNVKWILSSRNWASIRESLEDAGTEGVNLSLEVNAAVVTTAVDAYIFEKASKVPLLKQDAELKDEICSLVREKAGGTFLWVAIVFQQLQRLNIHYDDRSSVLERLNGLPKDLTELYDRMLQQIESLEKRESEMCKSILAIAVLAYQPLRLQELATLAGFKGKLTRTSTLQSLIQNCGSFLTVKDETLYFIHQSSKEYLTSNSVAQSTLFRNGVAEIHHQMAMHSIDTMTQKLCRDIYKLREHGILLRNISTPEPDPLVSLRYPCAHWLRHICDSITDSENSQQQIVFETDKVLTFLKGHILHWLEVISLMGNPSGGIPYISRFEDLLKRHSSDSELLHLIHDIRRFTQHNSWIINNAPLQIYISGILFSPKLSLVRSLFEENLLSWITIKPFVESQWSPCLQTIENNHVYTKAAISSDMKIAVRDSDAQDVIIWDISSGKLVQTLESIDTPSQLVFSADAKRVLAVVEGLVVSWDVASGTEHQQEVFTDYLPSLSSDGLSLASYVSENTILIQDVATGKQLSLIKDTYAYDWPQHRYIKLSNNAKYLAFGYNGFTIWDIAAHTENIAIEAVDIDCKHMSFSSDSKFMAWHSRDIEIWDLATKTRIQVIQRKDRYNGSLLATLEFSTDSKLVAGGIWSDIWVWDVATGNLHTKFKIEGCELRRLTWSPDSKILVSVTDENIKVWDTTHLTESEDFPHVSEKYNTLTQLIFTNDFSLVATTSSNSVVKVWDMDSGREVRRFEQAGRSVYKIAFSPDSKCLYTDRGKASYCVLEIASGTETTNSSIPTDGTGYKYMNKFSPDGKYFAELRAYATDATIRKTSTGEVFRHFAVNDGHDIVATAFSNNGQYLSLLSSNREVIVWDVTSGHRIMHMKDHACENIDGEDNCKRCKKFHDSFSASIAISNDSKRAIIAIGYGNQIWICSTGRKFILLTSSILEESFGRRESYITTSLGYIDINDLETNYDTPDSYKTITPEQLRFQGYGVSPDNNWITWNGATVCWLPVAYRPDPRLPISIAILPLSIFIVTELQNVVIIKFSGSPLC
ncbi:hypothetical protein V8C35DRAFT_321343 [Trichoderma chlorosporum]